MNYLKNNWLKPKGYLHISPQINVAKNRAYLLNKIENKNYVKSHAFFPLIHSIVKERKYKKCQENPSIRSHSQINKKGKIENSSKKRPLHYANHFDALIFGYYSSILQEKYESFLRDKKDLNESITAYRKIPNDVNDKYKSTINFAKEVFDEIRNRSVNDDCVVLTFDLKSFFSTLDHNYLKKIWCDLLQTNKLPDDHYNVFKAATKFSYIMKDDLRFKTKNNKGGFNEKHLSFIRNNYGYNAFFENAKEFREKVKKKELKIHKFPFRNKKKEPIGIPQGLPISAILANLYLLEFDMEIINLVVKQMGGVYRRYSDDIVIICYLNNKNFIKDFVSKSIEKYKVELSKDKTEEFVFKNLSFGNKPIRLNCCKITNDSSPIFSPFVYLGFEFNGHNTLIKSANLAKFYRRLISTVKRKAKRAIKEVDTKSIINKPIIYRRQLLKLYSEGNLNKIKLQAPIKKFVKTEKGGFKIETINKEKSLRSNYFSYAKRASLIMDEPKIYEQLSNHKKILNNAVTMHMKRKFERQ